MQEKEEAQEASQNLLVDGKNLVIVIASEDRDRDRGRKGGKKHS